MKVPCPMCGAPWPHDEETNVECARIMKEWKPTGLAPLLTGLKEGAAISLCPESSERAAMTDDEFWGHVFRYREDSPEWEPDIEPAIDSECPECGAPGACAYDSEGRPMIHSIKATDE
jgi:hypothetical protein